MKCRWKHCKYGGEVNKDEAIQVGIAYYHPQCYAEKESIQKIIDVFHERVDAHPLESFLRKTVNDLVLKENVDAEYLLFALNYCLDHGWKLRYPAGLKHVAKSGDAEKAWQIKQKKSSQGTKARVVINDEFKLDDAFTFKPQKAVGFGDILQ